jgi:cytochrome P450/glutathione S-transferase
MVIVNQLDHISFRKDFSYAKEAPTFVSTGVGGLDEIARWILDHNGILYKDEPHTPYISMEVINELTREPGLYNSPALVMTDTVLYEADSIIRYYELRCAPHLRLIPDDGTQQLVLTLYNHFTRDLSDLVRKYMFARLMPAPKLARSVFNQRAPMGEKLRWRLFYGILSYQLAKELNISFNTAIERLVAWLAKQRIFKAGLNLSLNTPEERLFEIKKIFAQVDALLADGRRYLGGTDKITIADIAFAAVAAPMILPEEFGGVIPQIEQVPEIYRRDIFDLRATAAGQFLLRVYQEDRPMPVPQSKLPKDPNFFTCIGQRLGILLAKGQPKAFAFLQRVFPVLKIPFVKIAIVTRNDLLVELLNRNLDFTIEEINSKHMASQKGAFFLGWDKNNPQFDRERDFSRACVRNSDLGLIRAIVREETDKVIRVNLPFGKIDVANTLCRPIYVRLMETYFGIAGPNDQIMAAWVRILFYDLFLNLTRNAKVHDQAVKAGVERRDWVRQVILDRMAVIDAGGALHDNVLNRMILLSRTPGYEWVDEDVINRNIGGIITGVLETSNKAVVYSLNVLLDRPEMLGPAVQTAIARKDDMAITMDKDPMYGYLAECLRFMPVQPGVLRFAEQRQTLTGSGATAYTIKPKTTILCMTAAAMMDPASFPEPGKFDPTRAAAGAPYKNWGFGLHECFGRYINTVLIPDFLAAVLRLPNLGRDDSMAGRGVGLKSQGGFPNNFVLTFDAPKGKED